MNNKRISEIVDEELIIDIVEQMLMQGERE